LGYSHLPLVCDVLSTYDKYNRQGLVFQKYHNLLMNKPRGGNYHLIDNHIVRATRYNGTWTPLVTVKTEIEVFEK
jgi:hypothetical protein